MLLLIKLITKNFPSRFWIIIIYEYFIQLQENTCSQTFIYKKPYLMVFIHKKEKKLIPLVKSIKVEMTKHLSHQ